MNHLSISPSSYHAGVILSVWQTGDRSRLCEELDRVFSLEIQNSNTAEQERAELLSQIAREWRKAEGREIEKREQLYCKLLQHLAGPVRRSATN